MQRRPLSDNEREAVDACPFTKVEDTAAIAVALAHREIVRLRSLPSLDPFEVKALETLARVIERAKEVQLKEWALKNKIRKP